MRNDAPALAVCVLLAGTAAILLAVGLLLICLLPAGMSFEEVLGAGLRWILIIGISAFFLIAPFVSLAVLLLRPFAKVLAYIGVTILAVKTNRALDKYNNEDR